MGLEEKIRRENYSAFHPGSTRREKGPLCIVRSIRVLEEDWLHNTALSRGRCVLREGPFIERWADRIYRVREV